MSNGPYRFIYFFQSLQFKISPLYLTVLTLFSSFSVILLVGFLLLGLI